MNYSRVAKHWMVAPGHMARAFPKHALLKIEAAITRAEDDHSGEIRFAVEGTLRNQQLYRGQTARERALDVFSRLRIWDTEFRNGVLIYLLLADREVEIVADRGIDNLVGTAEWERICRHMETAFRQRLYLQGVLSGIEAISAHLLQHYSAYRRIRNELPNPPVLL